MSNEDWGREEWRAPKSRKGEELFLDLPGHIIGSEGKRIDYRSHYIRIYKGNGGFRFVVSHGAGEENFYQHFNHEKTAQIIAALLDESDRYLVAYGIFRAHKASSFQASTRASLEYNRAFVEGRLKKRKVSGEPGYKVWIEAEAAKL